MHCLLWLLIPSCPECMVLAGTVSLVAISAILTSAVLSTLKPPWRWHLALLGLPFFGVAHPPVDPALGLALNHELFLPRVAFASHGHHPSAMFP